MKSKEKGSLLKKSKIVGGDVYAMIAHRKFDPVLLDKVKKIISRYTDRPEKLEGIEFLPDDTDINFISELNIDSVDVVEIVVDVEEAFGLVITDEEIHSFRSFGDMYDLIELKLNNPGDTEVTAKTGNEDEN